MTKNPLINGVTASAYILIIVSVMNAGMQMVPHPNSFMAPVVVVSLFPLPAAVMGYVFCYEPIQLYFDGKKKQGLNLFLHTTAVFGGFTALALMLFLTGVIK